MHLPPVHVAIVAFRGTRPLAAAIGKPRQRVQEWARPAADGGRDGEFPDTVIAREVYQAAKARGLALSSDALFFGIDLTPQEADTIAASMPPQARAAWWPLLHAPALSPARQRGR